MCVETRAMTLRVLVSPVVVVCCVCVVGLGGVVEMRVSLPEDLCARRGGRISGEESGRREGEGRSRGLVEVVVVVEDVGAASS